MDSLWKKFVTEIKKAAMKYELENLLESVTKSVLVCGIINNTAKDKLLQEDSFPFKCTKF